MDLESTMDYSSNLSPNYSNGKKGGDRKHNEMSLRGRSGDSNRHGHARGPLQEM